jgi:uncharacterized protein YidB (DUF937 family)
MGILDILKGVLSGKGGAQGGVAGAVQGAATGAAYGNPVGGAISGALGGGHPMLQMLLPMLLPGGPLALGGLLKKFHDRGMSKQATSWVAKGPNDTISPQQVEDALGADMVAKLAEDSGMNADEVKAQLSKTLPGVVDHLTPNGEMPTEEQLVDLLKTVDPAKVTSA